MRRKLVVGLSLVSAVSVGIVVLMAIFGGVAVNTLWFEVMKTLLQVGLVSAAGAALSIVTYECQRDAQRAEKLREESNPGTILRPHDATRANSRH